MNSEEIRQKFLDFFKNKQHQIVPSAPLVVKDDPTLMFTNAGMNQFKDIFLGNKKSDKPRIADTQKCLRVSGKHNDLEEVGIDTYHHTMFEMLGNWSFGNYFKNEAITWAWELLTEVYKLPKNRIYASVFEGDQADGMESDAEAFEIWSDILPKERIIYGSKKDNFWEMGESGPCGPCSEIHIDLRSDEEIKKISGKDLVNKDHPLVVEIWNLVFIQYNRLSSGELKNLPQKHIDTGMGFERLVMAIQGKKSNYDTDIFQPLILNIADQAGKKYGIDLKTDIAIRVMADHVRAVTFAVADGQLPSNNKAGYVIRRILRRAIRYGFTFLNFSEPVIFNLVDILADQFKSVFPEVDAQKEFIKRVIYEEEVTFLRTLDNGLKRFQQIRSQIKGGIIPGNVVFELYDTFGFPVDLTALIGRESGLVIDAAGFTIEMDKQKMRSKMAAQQDTSDWIVVKEVDKSEFLGYNQLVAEAHIVRYREVTAKKSKLFQIVLDQTPFYAESGGQVGDRGYIQTDGERIYILDTKKENEVSIHISDKLPTDITAKFTCVVNDKKRRATENNHSATHLLQAALKKVLGKHVQQRGSLVNEKELRFDFSHFAKMTDDEISEVEKIVNEKIRENIALDEKMNVPIEEAKDMGATALFGEKYGEFVRVITFNPEYSVELCGGTHVPATGKIGFFKIISENSIAAGIRRIEAYTAEGAEKYVNKQIGVLNAINSSLKHSGNVLQAVNDLLEERNILSKNLEKLKNESVHSLIKDLGSHIQEISGVNVIAEKISVPDAGMMKNLSFHLKAQINNLFLVLVAEINEKPLISVMISENLVSEQGLNANEIIKVLAKEINGGGGGQPFYATAGGKKISGIDNVLIKSVELVKNSIN